ncbi:MAG: hypothetical protein M1820_000568 [Bogoriella megaspora]|nr:MAG: hypothetical protein M1820_000568 [Bogoriella megaspora]
MDSDQSSDSSDDDTSCTLAYAPSGNLCQHCAKLTNRSLRGKRKSGGYGLTIGGLRASRSQCRMCEFVYRSLQQSASPETDTGDPKRRSIFKLVDERLASDQWPAIALAIGVEDSPGEGHYGPPVRGLRIAPVDGASKKLKRRIRRPPIAHEISDSTWELAGEWLRGCVTHHRVCRTSLSGLTIEDFEQEPPLPTRVFHIPAEGDPSVFVSNGQKAHYLALSYCWGSGLSVELTKQNLPQFRDRLPTDRIPRTITDAFEVARRLEVDYLWIDSLCILQDNDDDWEREAGDMSQIYSNALCTVAALGGETSESGLFGRSSSEPSVRIPYYSLKKGSRKYRGHYEVVQSLPFPVPKPSVRPVAGFRTIPRSEHPVTGLSQEIEDSRWNKRGWVFQERTLARRMLCFGKHQIYWECQMAAHSEDGVDRLINDYVPHEKKRQFRQLRHIDNPHTGFVTEMGMEKMDQYDSKGLPTIVRREPPKSRDDKITDHLLRFAAEWGNSSVVRNTPSPLMWALKSLKLGPGTFVAGSLDQGKLIRTYSVCHLSRVHDKLPAFGGLGEAIAKRTGQQYVAGIWTGTLAKGLFWYPVESLERAADLSRAPSWSWASWDGPIISFAEDEGEIRNNDDTEMKDPELWMQGGWSGSLKNEKFREENLLMERARSGKQFQRGVKPVSIRLTALFIDVDQCFRSCAIYDKLWGQLNGLLRTWPAGYVPWRQDQCHVLFMQSRDRKIKALTDPPSTPYKCPKCHVEQTSCSESSLLQHVEYCTGEARTTGDEIEQGDKLVGIARFDTPEHPPTSYRAIILWNNSDRSVFHGEGLYHPDQAGSSNDRKFGINLSSAWGYRQEELNALQQSENGILGFERCLGPPNTKQRLLPGIEVDIGGAWFAKVFPRRKRNYFLLLVEPTEWEGHYRRVGIGIGYWIPGVHRFGGLKLPDAARSEDVILL